jgi:acetylornithine deacetylase
LVQAVEAFTGTKAGAVAFGTEGPFLQKLGMDTVVLGPGSIDQAHQPDEYIPLDHLPATVTLLRKSISRFCADPTAPL